MVFSVIGGFSILKSHHLKQIGTFLIMQAFIMSIAFNNTSVSAPSPVSASEPTTTEKVTEQVTEAPSEVETEVVISEPYSEVATEIATELVTNEDGLKFLGYFWCTSYCSCPICCGQYSYNRPLDENGNEIVYGASGAVLTPGYSVAVDTSVIPYGSVLVINNQEYVAQDTGISGYHIDFYCDSHEAALARGNYWAEVYLK